MGKNASSTEPFWQRSVLPLGLLGGLLFYLAQPPVSFGLLAWVAPVPWLMLVKREKLPGRLPYWTLWLCGMLMWLATVQWLRLAYPWMYLATLLLAVYLGVYLTAFVALTRVAYHRLGMPLWRAAPIVWTGLELVRAHLATGFMMGSLAHTQVKFPLVLQISDLAGEYGVTFLIVLVAGALADALPHAASGFAIEESTIGKSTDEETVAKPQAAGGSWQQLNPAGVALVLAFGYGVFTEPLESANQSEMQTVALIQNDAKAIWKFDPERKQRMTQELVDLTWQAKELASKQGNEIDLVVWPETAVRDSLITVEKGYTPPEEYLALPVDEFVALTPKMLKQYATGWDAGLLLGIDRNHVRPPRLSSGQAASDEAAPFEIDSWNSVVFVDRAGEVQGTYDKMHLVPYGEYTPFSSWFPYPAGFTPLTGGVTPGEGPKSFEFEGVRYSPSVCYEKAVPHLMRSQFSQLAERGEAPDVLVNVTNDSWYWGSAELDMHLACGILRAVELRTPMLIAGNRGLSAHINAAGHVINVTQRNRPAVLLTQVSVRSSGNSHYQTLYSRWGDWLPAACLVCCAVFAAVGWRTRRLTA